MEGLSFTTATAERIRPSVIGFWVPRFSSLRRTKTVSFARKPRKFLVFASKEEPKLDPWDQMELKFGRLLGEDPKLTLAKIMGRKSNPGMSSLEIEKLFDNNKGKVLYDEKEEVPFDASEQRKASNSLGELNLVKPVPKKGVKFESESKPITLKENIQSQPVSKAVENIQGSIPSVILRKPPVLNDDYTGNDKSSRLRIKPNLSLKMGNEQKKERFSDITLLKKPNPISTTPNLDEKENYGNDRAKVSGNIGLYSSESAAVCTETSVDIALQHKPEMINHNSDVDQEKENYGNQSGTSSGNDVIETHLESGKFPPETVHVSKTNPDNTKETAEIALSGHPVQENDSVTGPQPREQSNMAIDQKSVASTEPLVAKLAASGSRISIEEALQGKPRRLDLSVKGTSFTGYGNAADLDNFLATSPIKESEDIDWQRAENLVTTGRRVEVELISASTRGFVVSFGSLIGFLPYRNLAAKWKFLAFESWLRRKGLDPSMYRQNLGVIESYEATSKATSLDSIANKQIDYKVGDKFSPDMKLEDLLQIYDKEKLKYLSSFVGQKIIVSLVLADRKSRRLVFSMKPKEKEELVEKKRNLMAKLSVGDVVKCCIKKITYFGVFVEIEGIPALIHQTEVSWDATLDPASYFKIGQIVEAKVHQLDFSLERIFLSLKEITPDPLTEALEAVVGDQDFLGGKLEVAQADTEWTDVESLIRELKQFEGIQSVSRGRYFLSPGLAPTFQVYMASMFENQYKLLARSGNKVQEVIVQTSLGKEEMKSAILTCTNRVE